MNGQCDIFLLWLSRRSVWGFIYSKVYSSIANPKRSHSYESPFLFNICVSIKIHFSRRKLAFQKLVACWHFFHQTCGQQVTLVGRNRRICDQQKASPGLLPHRLQRFKSNGWNGKDQLWTTNTMGAKVCVMSCCGALCCVSLFLCLLAMFLFQHNFNWLKHRGKVPMME